MNPKQAKGAQDARFVKAVEDLCTIIDEWIARGHGGRVPPIQLMLTPQPVVDAAVARYTAAGWKVMQHEGRLYLQAKR